MPISKPTLPPKAGYVEVIDSDVWSPDAYPTGWTVYTPEA